MADKDTEFLRDLEENQTKLRESIEESKRLAERSQQLLDYHRKEAVDSDEAAAE